MSASNNRLTTGSLQKFVAMVLAPIPASEEQANTPVFRKTILKDAQKRWAVRLVNVRVLKARHVHECRVGDCRSQAALNMFRWWREEIGAQMLIPAPTERELRWKRKHQHWHPASNAVQEAIAADEKRFAGGAA